MEREQSLLAALQTTDPFLSLRTVVQEMFDQRVSQDVILTCLERIHTKLVSEGNESRDDIVLEVMDCVVGWCSSNLKFKKPSDYPMQHELR